jgi:hypothetical protein
LSTDLRAFLARHRRFSRLVDDVAVTEIRVDESGDVRARKGGHSVETEGLGRSDAKALFEALGAAGKTCVVELGLHRWVRVEPPDVRPGPLVFATRVRQARLTPSELVATGYIEVKQLDALSDAVATGKGVLIVGPPLASPHRLMATLLGRSCDGDRHVVVLERRSNLDTTGLSPTCIRRGALDAGGALRGLTRNADVVVMDDVAGDDWELVYRRDGAASLLISVEVADHQVALLEAARRYLACVGADHVKLPSEAGVHMVAVCVRDGERARVRAVYEVPDKPLTNSTKYLSLKPVGGERKPLVPSKDTQELPPIVDIEEDGEQTPEAAVEAAPAQDPVEVTAKVVTGASAPAEPQPAKASAAKASAPATDPSGPAKASVKPAGGALEATGPKPVAPAPSVPSSPPRRVASKGAASRPRRLEPAPKGPAARPGRVVSAPEAPGGGNGATALPPSKSPLSVDAIAEPPTADEPPAPSAEVRLDPASSSGSSLASASSSTAPSSSIRKVRPSGRKGARLGSEPDSADKQTGRGRSARRSSARRAKRTEPMAVLPQGMDLSVAPDSPEAPSAAPEAPCAAPEVSKAAEVAVGASGSQEEMTARPLSSPGEGTAAPAPNEASLRMRRRLGRPPAGQAWARTESVAQSSKDLPDAATEEVASVDRGPSPKAEEGRLRPMPRAKGISRSAGNRSDSATDARRTPAEGIRARRLMTTGVVDRLPRPRKDDEPQERRTGSVRRLSRFGAAIDRQASFKPPERASDPSGLRDAGVEVHMGGAASGATSAAATKPGPGDDDIVTIQRPAAELLAPASAGDSDDTAELSIEDLTPKIVDEDDVTRERNLPSRSK